MSLNKKTLLSLAAIAIIASAGYVVMNRDSGTMTNGTASDSSTTADNTSSDQTGTLTTTNPADQSLDQLSARLDADLSAQDSSDSDLSDQSFDFSLGF